MNKLIVCIMGQNCERFIKMCLEGVKDADSIVYCDGGSTEEDINYINHCVELNHDEYYDFRIIQNEYNQEDLGMNGKQRNFYLNYLKENYPDDWCLCLDADEVVEDLSKIKEVIQFAKPGLYSVHMRHLIGDLSHEDTTHEKHYVPNRLFKISEADKYPEVEHPVLFGKEGTYLGQLNETTIWHLAYIPNMWEIKRRYDNHLKKSNMHNPEFLKWWYKAHLFGDYPKKEFNPVELPDIILNTFGIDKDELYFKDRLLETKHFIDAINWRDYFNCKTAIEFGCGRGPRVFALNNVGVKTLGVELSDFAVKNRFHSDIVKGNITDFNDPVGDFDLTIAYDVLEHLDYKDLDKAIITLSVFTQRYILISVPVKGDPNLYNDSTHKIKETKEWWIEQFTNKGLKLIKTPDHFLFKDQVIIFEKC